jgi:uncharacterized spore protein YtfJ
MEQVKAGAKIDSESGEAINNVEKVLLKNGIALRDNANSFRDMSDVLQDVAVKYKELGASGNTVAQQQIVGAIAGVRQANMLASLLDNWGQVKKAQDVAADSVGMATDRYNIYMQSVEASSNKLKVTWEKLWQSIVSSGFVKFMYDVGTLLLTPTRDIIKFGFGGVEGAQKELQKLKDRLEEIKKSDFGGDIRKKDAAIAQMSYQIQKLNHKILEASKVTDTSANSFHEWNDKVDVATSGTEGFVQSLDEIQQEAVDSLNKVTESMNAVTNASKEQNDQGYISNQTAINLIASNADLAQYLTQTANGYIFDADAARQATFIEMQNAFAKYNIADAAVDAANGNYKLAMSAIAASGAAADEQTAMIALLNAFAAMNVSVSVPSGGGGGGGVNEAEKAYQDLLDMTIKMLRQKKEAQKEALQQELNAYKDIIDARKKLLDQQRDEKKYQDEIADKNKKISDIENQLLALQFDNSEEAKAKRLKLEEEKAAAIKDLDDTQADHSVETQKDALDNEYDDFKKAIDKKIDAIDKYLSQSGKIAAQAIKLLKEHSDSLFNQLLKWNSVYGSGIQSDVIDKWALAAQAIGNYNSAVGGAIANTVNAINTIQDIIDGWGGDPIWDQVNPYGSSSPEPHHSGGVAGNGLPNLKSGEIYAKLLRGEVVANDQQMSDFINKTLPNLVSGVSNSSTTSIGDIVFHVAGSLDKSVIPDIQKIIMDTIDKTNKNRGILRTVKSFSV